MSKTLVIADTHFGWCGPSMEIVRPQFKGDGRLMDKLMIYNWNEVAAPDDLIYLLGDACMCPKRDATKVIRALNGRKVLVRGNHDRGYPSMTEMGFIACVEECVIYVKGCPILLAHRPREFLLPNVSGMFCGHIHKGAPIDLYEAGEITFIQPFCVNVCVEETKYTPIRVEDALGRLKLRVRGTEYAKVMTAAKNSRKR